MVQARTFMASMMKMMFSVANNNVFADQLPMTIKSFVSNHFQNRSIESAEKNVNSKQFKYELTLNDGTLLNFNDQGEWTMATNIVEGVPTSIYPSAINNFVDSCFSETKIVTITKKSDGYVVVLSNNLNVKFNNEGLIYGLNN